MNPHPPDTILWWCNLVLRLASWLVPSGQRKAWRQKWELAIWHWCRFLVESGRLTVPTEQELLRHCWGAVPDALWQRFNRETVLRLIDEAPRTPRFCLVGCTVLLFALLLGRPSAVFSDMFSAGSQVDPHRLLTVTLADKSPWLTPEVLRDAAARLPKQTQLINASAAYAWRPTLVRGPEGTDRILTARIAPGAFELLGVHASFGRTFQPEDEAVCQDCVVLSNWLWKSQFRADPRAIGRLLIVNGSRLRIIGVLPPQFRFPGREIGAYRLFGANGLVLPKFEWPGALLQVPAGLDSATAKKQVALLMAQAERMPADAKFNVASLKDLESQSLRSWAYLVLLALVLLLVLKIWQFARLHVTGPQANLRERLRWYLFLSLKTTLLLMAALLASLDLVHAAVTRSNSASGYSLAAAAAIWVFLFGANMALTWSIRDQLRRCRVCLRGLGVRVDLGSAAHILLETTGVELVCDEGHGALHVPVMESGSVDCERWTYLDDSWHVLQGPRETRLTAS